MNLISGLFKVIIMYIIEDPSEVIYVYSFTKIDIL